MSKQSSKTAIGVFVIGAIALLISGVVILGSGEFFKKTYSFVMYFDGSVKGLSVGAPVVFRGVQIGTVKSIELVVDYETLTEQVPVFVDFDPSTIRATSGTVGAGENLPAMIEKGLRAQLQIQSLITGQLMIELNYYPDKPARLVGTDTGFPEVPTVPTTFDEVTSMLRELPIRELMQKITATFDGLEKLINAPETREIITNANEVLKDARRLVQDVDSQVEPLAASIEGAIGDYAKLARDVDREIGPLASNVNGGITDARKLVRNVDKQIEPLSSKAQNALVVARSALKKAEKAIDNIESLTADDSTILYEVNTMLKELSRAARSIRVWAEYLERHPEALVRGKGGRGGR
jgi:paraquat-inducible protein B